MEEKIGVPDGCPEGVRKESRRGPNGTQMGSRWGSEGSQLEFRWGPDKGFRWDLHEYGVQMGSRWCLKGGPVYMEFRLRGPHFEPTMDNGGQPTWQLHTASMNLHKTF